MMSNNVDEQQLMATFDDSLDQPFVISGRAIVCNEQQFGESDRATRQPFGDIHDTVWCTGMSTIIQRFMSNVWTTVCEQQFESTIRDATVREQQIDEQHS